VVHFLMIGTGSATLSFQGSSAVVRSTDNKSILGASPSVTYTLSGTPAAPGSTSASNNGATPTDTSANGSTLNGGSGSENLTPNGVVGSIFSNALSIPSNTLKMAEIGGAVVLLLIVGLAIFKFWRRKQTESSYYAGQLPVAPTPAPQATPPLDQPSVGQAYPPENNDQNGAY